MSRIGNQPVKFPSGVSVELKGDDIVISGPKGSLTQQLSKHVTLHVDNDQVSIKRTSDAKKARSEHGLMKALVENMVIGVSQGFSKKLEVHGVGFKTSLSGTTLRLSLGYSHENVYNIPEGVELSVEDNTIEVKGIDKQQVGQVAAEIRRIRKPDPYKGKGIRYSDEYIIRKAGKTAAATGGSE